MATKSRAWFRAETPGHGQSLIQRGQGFGEPASHSPALGQGPVQVDQEVGMGGGDETPPGHAFRLGRVADPVQRLGEQAQQAFVLR